MKNKKIKIILIKMINNKLIFQNYQKVSKTTLINLFFK